MFGLETLEKSVRQGGVYIQILLKSRGKSVIGANELKS